MVNVTSEGCHIHTYTHLVRLSWISDRPAVEASTCTLYNTHKKQISMPLAGIEPAIPTNAIRQTYALDRAATEIGQKAIC